MNRDGIKQRRGTCHKRHAVSARAMLGQNRRRFRPLQRQQSTMLGDEQFDMGGQMRLQMREIGVFASGIDDHHQCAILIRIG